MTSAFSLDSYGHYAANVSDTAYADGEADALWVGSLGDVQVIRPDNTQVAFLAVPAGTLLKVKSIRVEATGTTATGIVVLYHRKPRP